jgi:DNA invertase Pin-like site-specific DNA recombinase
MARYATYIRASTDDQETSHQRDAIDLVSRTTESMHENRDEDESGG